MKYAINGRWYTVKELSDLSGIMCHTIRDRLRRGYSIEEAIKVSPVHQSVRDFCDASWYEDWIGMSINDLYEIFWKWCISNGYNTVSKQCFSRQLFSMFPQLKTIPTQRSDGCHRIIRLRG